MTNLVEGLHTQLVRCREILKHYEELGPVGTFGAMAILRDIEEAECALRSCDVVRMIKAFQILKEVKE